MINLKPSIQGHHIVLVGDFNPKIFQPAWFGAEELLRKGEADGAQVEIIHPEVVIFSLEWLRLEVTRDRFSAATKMEAYDEVVRDLIVGTFRLLRHTPLRKMGVNREMHFQMQSEDQWNEIGHSLAPKTLWENVLEKPGMRSMVIQGMRQDELKGYIQVAVEPSTQVHPGVYMRVNDHFEVKDPKSSMGSDEIIGILECSWKESYSRSRNIIDTVLEKFI